MSKKTAVVTEDLTIEQRDNPVLPDIGDDIDDREPDIATPAGGYRDADDQKYQSDLAFMEEPVTIQIHGSSEDDGFRCTDYVAVNGIAAQILLNGKWVNVGFLPKDQVIVTKRKFVDALLRAKRDKIRTHTENVGGQVINNMFRTTLPTMTVSLIEDKNRYGVEWFKRRFAQNF